MNQHKLYQWLFDNGGPAIRYRTAVELMDNCPKSLERELAGQLLENKKVKSLLQMLDEFETCPSFENIFEFMKIHSAKSPNIENVVPRLLHMGLRKGIPEFDKRMRKLRIYVDNGLVSSALENIDNPTTNDAWAMFSAGLLASYFIWGGYEFDESINIIKRQIDLIYKTASTYKYDIYLTEEEIKSYKLHPQERMKDLVLKPGLTLPTIYDIFYLAYLPDDVSDNRLNKQINYIIQYILDEKFQLLNEGYGYVFLKLKNHKNYTLYGHGWRPVLPGFFNFDSEHHIKTIVLYLDLMPHFKLAVQSNWLNNCIEHLEQFRTESGTYCFPPNYLIDKKDGYYVLGNGGMGLEEKRTKKSLELESTFWMCKFKKRMQ